MTTRATRRAFLGASALVATGAAAFSQNTPASARLAIQDAAALVGDATTPVWEFSVYRFADPYEGLILRPETLEPEMRYVGAEVAVHNQSNDALAFTPGAIRLRDTDSIEYLSGTVIGESSRILDINMLPGERARGWVWFAIPEGAEIADLTYVAPAPRLSVDLTGVDNVEAEATPG